MPADFHFPRPEVDLWTPERLSESDFTDRNNNYLQVIARLKPTVSLAQARAEMNVVAGQVKAQFPKGERTDRILGRTISATSCRKSRA